MTAATDRLDPQRPPADVAQVQGFYCPPSVGYHLHRCEVCWPEAHPADNGYVPGGQPVPHVDWCSYKGRF